MANPVSGSRVRIILLLAVCIATAACDWPWRHDMANQPSRPAAAGPRSPAPGSNPTAAQGPLDRAAGESVSNPLPPGASTATGKALYEKYCLPCHDGPVGQYFPRMPQLGSPDVQRHGDGWIYATITDGTALMPAYGHELDPTERWQIVRFVREMAR
jgi:S-disulfanyl-L-cysteine oxidoreductase SoxD